MARIACRKKKKKPPERQISRRDTRHNRWRCWRQHHLDDVQQLVAVDAAVAVHVVELEVPAQLVLHLAAHHQAERRHVLHEVYVAVLRSRNHSVLTNIKRLEIIHAWRVVVWETDQPHAA